MRRVSVGGALAQVAWAALPGAAARLRDGSFAGLAGGTPGAHWNEVFSRFA